MIIIKYLSPNLEEIIEYLEKQNFTFQLDSKNQILIVEEESGNLNFKGLKRFLDEHSCLYHWFDRDNYYLSNLKECVVDFKIKGVDFNSTSFDWWLGPCSLDSLENLYLIARKLKQLGVKILRAGAFKPRTFRRSFQGIGIEGLDWLAEVGKEFNLITVSEMTSLEYLDEFLEKVDIIQVGARNMFNYPLLKELGKVDKPILLKRHFGATRDEFLGSADYILSGGNQRLILCERGIRTFSGEVLDLNTAFFIKENYSLPLILDLTHSAQKPSYIEKMAMAFRYLPFNGLMLEVHPFPHQSLSESDRILALDRLGEIFSL